VNGRVVVRQQEIARADESLDVTVVCHGEAAVIVAVGDPSSDFTDGRRR
jgi:hypothetical protein